MMIALTWPISEFMRHEPISPDPHQLRSYVTSSWLQGRGHRVRLQELQAMVDKKGNRISVISGELSYGGVHLRGLVETAIAKTREG